MVFLDPGAFSSTDPAKVKDPNYASRAIGTLAIEKALQMIRDPRLPQSCTEPCFPSDRFEGNAKRP